jgi:hypothetical protein
MLAGVIVPGVLVGGAWLAKAPRATGGQPPDVSCRDVLALRSESLASLDIAALNLVCAEGLPGAEALNPTDALHTLDQCRRNDGSSHYVVTGHLNTVGLPALHLGQ